MSSDAACILKSATRNWSAAARRGKLPVAPMSRGYIKLYFDHVQQVEQGADLDFLVGASGSAIPKDNH